MKKIIFLIGWLSAVCLGQEKCDISLQISVADFHNGEPLADAFVLTKQASGWTNANGVCLINNYCKDSLLVTVQHLACEPVQKKLWIYKDTSITIYLEHHIEELDKVTLKGFKHHKEAISSVETSFEKESIAKSTNTNIADLIKNSTGVSVLSTGNTISKPIIHGMHSSRVGIINNNSRLQDQEWGQEHDPSIDLNSANSITVIKGASALEYGGDLIGGAVIIHPVSYIKKDTLQGSFQNYINSVNRGFGTSLKTTYYKKNGFYANAFANYHLAGDSRAPRYQLSNTGFNKLGGGIILGRHQFKGGWQIDYSFLKKEIGILLASHISGARDLVNAIESQQPNKVAPFTYRLRPPRQEITHHALKGSYFKRFKSVGKFAAFYSFQQNHRAEFDLRRGGRSNIPAIDLTLTTHQAKTTFAFEKNNTLKVKVGLEGQYQKNFPDPSTGVKRIIPDYQKYDIGGFAISKYHFKPTLIAELAVRYDFSHIYAQKFYREFDWNSKFASTHASFFKHAVPQNSQVYTEPNFNFHNLSLHAGVWWEISETTDTRFSFGVSNRNPNPAELFSDGLHQSAAAYEVGSLNLKQETSYKMIGEFAYHTPQTDVILSPYAQYLNNFIYLSPSSIRTTLAGAFLEYTYLQNHAFIGGVDTEFDFKLTPKLKVENKISYLYAQNIDTKEAIIGMPPLNGTSKASYLQNQWEFIGEVAWWTTQNRVPNQNFTITIDGKEKLVPISKAPKGYTLLHASVQRTLPYKKNYFTLLFGIQNILNTKYRSYLDRNRFFADEAGRNIYTKLNFNF